MKSKRMKEFKKQCDQNYYGLDYGLEETAERDSHPMNTRELHLACHEFFNKLADILEENYTVVDRCNGGTSKYLVPKGTEEEISYYGKPLYSFRISDHWNWYSNLKKCSDPNYIQCESVDMPAAAQRQIEGRGTNARRGYQVAILLEDGKYHHVYGIKWCEGKCEYQWQENDPTDILETYGLIGKAV